MNRLVFACLFLVVSAAPATAQNGDKKNGFGVRLGEPLGFTYKRLLTPNRAFELVLGMAPKSWDKTYYRNTFDKEEEYDGYEYRSHKVSSSLFIQGRVLFQKNIPVPELGGNLQWYWGIGGLFKTADLEYHYRTQDPPYEYFDDERTDIDFGPEGIGGLEYGFKKLPLTIFLEFSLMVEIIDRPEVRVFGAAGARFNF